MLDTGLQYHATSSEMFGRFFFFFDVLFSLHDLVFHKLVPLMSDELNIEGVARDIELLYSSSNALEIHELQERLQTYQKSEIGYQLGFKL